MLPKPAVCAQCPMANIGIGFVPLTLRPGATLLVGEAPGENEAERGEAFVGPSGSVLNNLLRASGQDRGNISTINVLSCRPPNNIFPTDFKQHYMPRSDGYGALEYCKKHHLEPALAARDWKKIYAVGDQALQALTPRKGILVWRGSPLPLKGDNSRLRVIPTLHPSYLMRDFSQLNNVVADLRKNLEPVPENYNLYATADQLAEFNSRTVAFDFEWDRFENITICGISGRFYEALTGTWDNAERTAEFKRIFTSATDLIGHNIIGADTKYFERMGWHITARMHDTMLKQHLIQPDQKHGLGFVASVFTNKMFWKGKGIEQEDADGNVTETKYQWRTWNTPEAIPRTLGGYGGCISDDEAYRLYNARDTDGSLQINTHLDTLLEKWGLMSVYRNVSVPISYICRDISDAGLRIDGSKIHTIREELGAEIIQLERDLPEGLRPYEQPINRLIDAPPGTYKPKSIKCKGTKKAGTAHDPVTITVLAPRQDIQCPSCGKQIASPKLLAVKKIKVPGIEVVRPWASAPKVIAYARAHKLKVPIKRERGTETADVQARAGWGRTHPEFRTLDRIKKLATEVNTFAKESMLHQERLYFRLNPVGTSEGRFSSNGQRKGIDPNIQNQPLSIRKIYIPDQDTYRFVELDYSGGENWLTAWLAQDKMRLSRLGQPDYNEHLDLARQIFDCPDLSKSKEDEREFWGQRLTGFACYDIAKHANHGSNYGMTWTKLQEYLEAHGIFFTAKQCKDVLAVRVEMNPETARWQQETVERAKRDGFLRNAFGRIRWFSSRSVSTESLAFLPASTLADIIIRAMIGHYPDRFPDECGNLGLTAIGEMVSGWRIAAQIHDSLLMQGPGDTWETQALRSKAIMEQKWKELGGFSLTVEAKCGKIGASWGSIERVALD